MSDIVERLDADLAIGCSASMGDTKEARDEIVRLRAERDGLRDALSSIRRRAIFGPGLTVGDLLDLTGRVAPQDEPTVERQHDATNPFAPRERPQKPIRLMTDAERRAAGLDPNGGFDGPTGAD